MDEYVVPYNLQVFGEIGRVRWDTFMSAIAKSPSCNIWNFPPIDIFDIRHQFLKGISRVPRYGTQSYVRTISLGSTSDFYEYVLDILCDESITTYNAHEHEGVIFQIMKKDIQFFGSIAYEFMLRECSDEMMEYWMSHNSYDPSFNFLECVKHRKMNCFKKMYHDQLEDTIAEVRYFNRSHLKYSYETVSIGEIHDALNDLAKLIPRPTPKSVTPKS